MNPPHEQIAALAYRLWKEDNYSQFVDDERSRFYWLQAEQQLRETGWEQKGSTQ